MNKLSVILKMVFVMVISLAAMVFYESCCGAPDFLYYDIESMEVQVENNQIAPNDTLKMFMTNQKYKFLNFVASPFSSAYALSCEFDGEGGPKYKYTEFKITSDKAVDDLHPAGTNLNDLFLLLPYQQKALPLSQVANLDSVAQMIANRASEFGMAKKPTANSELEFLIYFKNSNNREITVKTSLIRWN